MTHWQPNWSASGAGRPGTYLFQLLLEHGASEVVLTLTDSDADDLYDWLSGSKDIDDDLERELLISGVRSIG